MTQYRALRDCPQCGARKGFACRSEMNPLCPQLQDETLQAELDRIPFLPWPFTPPDDPSGAA